MREDGSGSCKRATRCVEMGTEKGDFCGHVKWDPQVLRPDLAQRPANWRRGVVPASHCPPSGGLFLVRRRVDERAIDPAVAADRGLDRLGVAGLRAPSSPAVSGEFAPSLCEAIPPSLPVHAQVGYGTAGLRGRVPLTESLEPLRPATAQAYRSPGRSSTASDSTGVCAGPRFAGAKGTSTSHNRLRTNRGSRARSPKSVAECVRSLSQASSG